MIRNLISKEKAAELGIAPDSNGRFYHETYQGCVFGTYSQNLYFGDFAQYAIVWDAPNQKLISVCFDYNVGGGSPESYVNVDITPENWDAALQLDLPKIRAEVEASLEADHYQKATALWGGKRIKVIAGRKYPLGLEGTIKWAGETRFGFSAKVIWDNGDEGWIAQHNIEVINVPDYVPDQATIDRKVEEISKHFWTRYR